MNFTTPPPDFSPKFDIVGCYVEYGGKVIMLKRQSHKPQGSQYGVPAGKVDTGENLSEAMSRELREETGITANSDDLQFLRSFPIRYPAYDFMFHVFKLVLSEEPEIIINKAEHSEWVCIKPEEILTRQDIMDQVPDITSILYNLKRH